jgi:photosystem II stability/assembly factor-like uncharacterized protein
VIINTTDGGISWNSQISGTTNNLFSIHFADSQTGWAVGNAGTVLKTNDGGTNWIPQESSSTSSFRSVYFVDNQTGWIVGSGGTILKTTNGGTNWFPQTSGGLYGLRSVHFIDSQTGWTAGSAGIILKTTSGGTDWISQSIVSSTYLRCIYFTDPQTGWIVGDNATLNGTILKTTDGGTSWVIQANPTMLSLNSIYFVTPQIGWTVGYYGSILNTINGSIPVELTSFTARVANNEIELSWQTSTETNNYGFKIERKKMLTPREENELNEVRVWESLGFVEGKGTTTEPQYYLFVDKNMNAGTYSYRLKQIDFDGSFDYSNIVEVDVGIPNGFFLSQNYPNPFNPSTKINFRISQTTFASLKVYSLLGAEVVSLLNEVKTPGVYEVNFDVTNPLMSREGLTSGVYFYRLQAGTFVQTKKMLYLK